MNEGRCTSVIWIHELGTVRVIMKTMPISIVEEWGQAVDITVDNRKSCC